jgi:hypothetical protein
VSKKFTLQQQQQQQQQIQLQFGPKLKYAADKVIANRRSF